MSMFRFALICALFAGIPAAAARAEEKAERRVITNYWRHINELVEEERAKRARARTMDHVTNAPPRRYVFEAFEEFKPREIMRAVNEGIEAARRANFGQPDEVVLAAQIANVMFALEYYPLVARDPRDFATLFHAMENPLENPALRLFLLDCVAPGIAPDSLFTRYFQDRIGENPEEVRKMLDRILGRPHDTPRAVARALEISYALTKQDFTAKLGEIEGAAQFAADQGAALSPEFLLAHSGAMPEDLRIAVSEAATVFNELLSRIQAILDPFGPFVPEVRHAARGVLERMHDELPLENRRRLAQLLEAHPAESLDAPPPEAPQTRGAVLPGVPDLAEIPGFDPDDPATFPLVVEEVE